MRNRLGGLLLCFTLFNGASAMRLKQRRPHGITLGRPVRALQTAARLSPAVALALAAGLTLSRPALRLLDRRLLNRRRHDRPNRIILVRHGESEGNLNKSLYCTTPDSLIRLTARGFLQGVATGEEIHRLIGNESVTFFYSPYMRTRQTLLGVSHAWRGRRVKMIAEPRLREQDFGNFQDVNVMLAAHKERRRFGRLWYRFPSGEAGSDVYGRAGDLWATLRNFMDHPRDRPARNVVLVTHGLLMRYVCMFYFGWTEQEFEQVWNPSNGECWVLDKIPVSGRYELRGRWDAESGAFKPIRFGKDKCEAPFPHMMRCRPTTLDLPSESAALMGLFQASLGVSVPDGIDAATAATTTPVG